MTEQEFDPSQTRVRPVRTVPTGGVESQPRTTSVSDLANLDVIRAYAVILVFISHVPTWRAWTTSLGFNMGLVGSLGVAIFFVHTSLVLLASFERQIASEGKGGAASRFLIRRVFRIYPLSIASVLAWEALAATGLWPSGGLRTVVADLLLVQNLVGAASVPATLWSLPFEMQMYLVLPMLFWLVVRAKNRASRMVAGLLMAATGIALLFGFATPHWCFSIFQRIKFASHFLPGVLAYALSRQFPRPTLPPWTMPAFVTLAALTAPFLLPTASVEPWATVAQWVVCLAIGLLIPRCKDSLQLSVNRFAKSIAKYSYGIYLVHMPVVEAVYHQSSPIAAWARVPLLVASTAALSVVVFHTIEDPCIRMGKQIARKLWLARSYREEAAS